MAPSPSRAARPRREATLDLSSSSRVAIALLSDTHGFVDPRVLAAVEGADLVVHGGDVGSAAVLDALSRAATEVVAVQGNNDVPAKWPEDDAAVLGTLPQVFRVALPGGLLVVEHGHEAGGLKDRHARLRKRYPDARAIAVGHSHLLAVDDDEEPWVLNPGAAGSDRTHGGPSFVSLVATRRRWQARATRFPKSPSAQKR